MSACPQCGTVAKPSDKFCNTCGTPVARPAGAAAPAPQAGGGYAAPPPQQGYGGAPPQQGAAPARCQMGHDIAPGASYCAQGHPIALDAMQFAQDAYGQPAGYGGAPAPQQGGGGYGGAPQQGYGAPQGQYGAPPPQQGYGGAPQPSPQPIGGAAGFGGDQGYGGYGQQAAQPPMNPAFNPAGGPAPAQGYGQAPPAQGYGAPAPQQGYGGAPAAPAQPMFNQAAQPSPSNSPPAAPTANTAPDANSKALRGFIVAYQTNANGDFWPLTGGRHVVGRSGSGETVDVQLADPTISSKHAAIVVDGGSGTITIEDTGSTNGTFVNDEHLGFNGRRDVRDGDRVRFGGFTTIVKVIGRV